MSINLWCSLALIDGFNDAINGICLNKEEFSNILKKAAKKKIKISDDTAEALEICRLEFFK